MRILLAMLVLAASSCDFGDNRRLELQGDCGVVDECDLVDAGGGDGDADRGDGDGGADSDAQVDEVCTLVAQTGCPDDRACDLDDAQLEEGGTECRRIDKQGRERSTCVDPFDCAAGFTCVEDPAGGASCLAFCADDGDCDGPGGACNVQLVTEDDEDIPGGTLCTQSCNPLSSNGCPNDWGCRVNVDHTFCQPAGPGRHLDSCVSDEDCDEGYGCVEANGIPRCLRNCRVGVLGVCSALSGTTCRRYSVPAMIGNVEYGVCF